MASRIWHRFRIANSLYILKNSLKSNIFQRAISEVSVAVHEIDLQNEQFNAEKQRQLESVGRIEKIAVNVSGPPEDTILYMNKDISTPYDCGKHISESILNRAALAVVDNEILWDMHRPLTSNCNLKFLYFDDEDPEKANKIFWESCCFILGAVIVDSFKSNINVMLHSYPPPDYQTGSFVYDVKLSLNNWCPKNNELRVLTTEMLKFCSARHDFERLTVSKDFALTMFESNPFKVQQINEATSKDIITLYRIGKHIDISSGPLMSHTSLVNMCTITAVHKLKTTAGLFYRFQGVALPKPLFLNHFAYGLLENRAKKLNCGRLPAEVVPCD